jgi:hypothetical protein
MRLVALVLAFVGTSSSHCPVTAAQLRSVHVPYRGFDGGSHMGTIGASRKTS